VVLMALMVLTISAIAMRIALAAVAAPEGPERLVLGRALPAGWYSCW
jgi:hypothetical protein